MPAAAHCIYIPIIKPHMYSAASLIYMSGANPWHSCCSKGYIQYLVCVSVCVGLHFSAFHYDCADTSYLYRSVFLLYASHCTSATNQYYIHVHKCWYQMWDMDHPFAWVKHHLSCISRMHSVFFHYLQKWCFIQINFCDADMK